MFPASIRAYKKTPFFNGLQKSTKKIKKFCFFVLTISGCCPITTLTERNNGSEMPPGSRKVGYKR